MTDLRAALREAARGEPRGTIASLAFPGRDQERAEHEIDRVLGPSSDRAIPVALLDAIARHGERGPLVAWLEDALDVRILPAADPAELVTEALERIARMESDFAVLRQKLGRARKGAKRKGEVVAARRIA